MNAKRICAIATLMMLAGGLPAAAQSFGGDDPTLVLPEVLAIIDTSGSMRWGSYPGLSGCTDPDYWIESIDGDLNGDGDTDDIYCPAEWYNTGDWYWFASDIYECNSGGRTCRRMQGNYCAWFASSPFSDGNTCFRSRTESAIEILTGFYQDNNMSCSNQDSNGIFDMYADSIRFGFATFDNNGGRTSWDYGDDLGSHWRLGIKDRCPCDGTDNSGPACSCGPTNGQLVDVVDPSDPNNLPANNARVQAAACQMNASGGTPLAPALHDAAYYFSHYEDEIDYEDDLSDCRPRFVLLFTDGMENSGSTHFGGPYQCAANKAAALCNQDIPVFVIGYGDEYSAGGDSGCPTGDINGDGAANIDDIAIAGTNPNCNPDNPPLLAFLADNPADLYAALQTVMNAILSGAASRTEVASTPSLMSADEAYAYTAYFTVSLMGGWVGHLLRIPVTDSNNDGVPEWNYGSAIDFYNVLYNQDPSERRIYSVVNDPRSQTFSSADMPRPVDDSDSSRGLWPLGHGSKHDPFVPWMCTPSDGKQICHEVTKIIRGENGAKDISGNVIRDGHPILGDIFHSNPVVVSRPTVLAPDYKYELYFLQNKDRPTMVYVGANDGMLHAFVGEDPGDSSREGQELWGFIPTRLLAKIKQMQYGHDIYVDGTPVVRDVYFHDIQATDADGNPIFDSNGKPVMGAYRTVLVSGLRGGGNAYFALDVTDAENPKYLWEYRPQLPITADYLAEQCDDDKLESWSKPIVGQVWLKNAHAGEGDPPEPAFVGRSVMIVPGGYMPPQKFGNIRSCIDFVEMIVAANTLHIIDIETGKLLRKVVFSSSVTPSLLADLQAYYDALAADPTDDWDATFASDDSDFPAGWGWGNDNESVLMGKEGWICREDRDVIANQATFPVQEANCEVTDDDVKYRMECCWRNATPHDDCNINSTSNCHYTYIALKASGAVMLKIKGSGCPVNDTSLALAVGENFTLETTAANPVAYNTAFGEYVNRVFVPTTAGKIWRLDMRSAEYDREKPEGEMVYSWSDGTVTYDWDVSRDGSGNPIPWFDAFDTAYGGVSATRRPIMVEPSLALNYRRNLVLFFGTGRTDDISYYDTQDYIFAVEETRTMTGDGFYVPDATGKLFCQASYGPSCAGSGMPKTLANAERLYGKPLVAAGNVYFTTYTPSTDDCEGGRGRIYAYRFDDFQQEIIPPSDMPNEGPPRQPQLVWTKQGPVPVTGQGGEVQVMPTEPLTIGAQIMHWGRVL